MFNDTILYFFMLCEMNYLSLSLSLQFQMKKSGNLNPSEETGTRGLVSSKYGRIPLNKHGGVG